MTNIHVVVGAQFGSEAKGSTVAHLARKLGSTSRSSMVVRVAGPNAGHTAYDDQGREWKLRAVPVAAVANLDVQLHIAAGSEIDPTVLADEVTALDEAGFRVSERLTIHPSATILTQRNIDHEASMGIVGRIGSTGKGIGAARADRIKRIAPLAGELYKQEQLSEPGPLDLADLSNLIVEGTQGYGLGLHTTFYPQVTSSDCRAIDFLAMAGVSPWSDFVTMLTVYLVARTYPIRVAGNSGPLLGETSWEKLGLPIERTTVTNKVRRVGEWDQELVHEAIEANGGGGWNPQVQLVLTMLDQLFPETAGMTELSQLPEAARLWLATVQDDLETDIAFVGTSPTTMFNVEGL